MGNDITKGIIGTVEIAAGAIIPGAQFLIPMGAGMVAGSIAGMLSKPPDRATRAKDLGANLCDPTTALPVVYGKTRVGIARAFLQSAQYQATNNFHLWIIGALCHGPVNGIDEVYLDGNLVFDQQGVVTATPDKPATNYLGNVAVWKAFGTDGQKTIEPRSAVTPSFTGAVTGTAKAGAFTLRITFGSQHPFVPGDVVFLTGVNIMANGDYPITAIPSATQIDIDTAPDNTAEGGGAGGTVDYFTPDLTLIFPGQWTPEHNGKGIAYVVVRCNYDPTLFPNGVPKVECVVRGKPLHDPRTPVTLTIQQVYQTAGVGPYLTSTSIKTTAPHGLVVGQIINVQNCYNGQINGYQRVAVILSATDFTCYVEYGVDIGTPSGTIDVLSTATGFDPSALNPNSNPALAVRDYLTDTRYGISTPIAEINDNAFAGEASYCDQVINTPWVDRGDLTAATFYIWRTQPNPANPLSQTDIILMEQVGGQITPGDIVQFVGAQEPQLSDIAVVTAVNSVSGAQLTSFTVNLKTVQTTTVSQGTVRVICPASSVFCITNIVSTAPVSGNAGSNLGHTNVTVSSAVGFSVGQTVFVQGTLIGSNSYALKGQQGIVAISGNVLTLGGSTKGTDTSGTGHIIGTTPVGQQPAESVILGTTPTGTWTEITLSQPVGTYVVGSTVFIQDAANAILDGIHPVVGLVAPGSAVIKIAVDTTSIGALPQGGTAQQMIAAAQYQVNGAIDTARTVKDNMEAILSSFRSTLVYQAGQYRTWTRRVVTPTGFVLDESNIVGDWDIVTPSARDMANIVRVIIGQNKKKKYQTDFAEWPDPNDTAFINQFYLDDNSVFLRKEYEVPLCNDFWQAQILAQALRRESRTAITVGITCTEAALQLAYGDVIAVTHATPGWVQQLFWVLDIGINPDHTVRLTLLFYDPTAYVLETFSDAPLPSETTLANSLFCNPPANLAITNVSGYFALLLSWDPSPDADVDHYEIQWKVSSSAVWLQANNTTAAVTSVNLPIPDLTLTYDVQVRAVNAYAVASVWVQDLGSPPSGGSGNTPIPCPPISASVETENALGWQGPIGIISWVNPTSVFLSHMGCVVQVTGATAQANVNMGVTAPYRMGLAPNTSYTLTPFTVTTTGVATYGTAITVVTPPSAIYGDTFSLTSQAGGFKLVVGSYTVAAGGQTAATPVTTWTGTNPNVATEVGLNFDEGPIWVAASSSAIATLTVNPIAADGNYTLTYDLSGSLSGGATAGFGRVLIEFATNGGAWQAYGFVPQQALPCSFTNLTGDVLLTATQLAGATTVAFRLTAEAVVTANSAGHSTTCTATATATGVEVQWNFASTTPIARRGHQVLAESNNPHLTLAPTSSPPVATNAVPGEVTMTQLGTNNVALQVHDGNKISTLSRYETHVTTGAASTSTNGSFVTVSTSLLTGIAVAAGEVWDVELAGSLTTGVAVTGAAVTLVNSGGTLSSAAWESMQPNTGSGSAAMLSNSGGTGTNPGFTGGGSTVVGVRQRWTVTIGTAGTLTMALQSGTSGTSVTLNTGARIHGRRVS